MAAHRPTMVELKVEGTMHARVTTVQVKPGRLDDFISIFQEFTIPAAAKQRGFEGALLLADALDGQAHGYQHVGNGS